MQHVDIHVAIAIEVRRHDAEPTERLIDTDSLRDIGERAIPSIFEHRIGQPFELPRSAVIGNALRTSGARWDFADRIVVKGPVRVVRNIQVEQPIVVGIEKCRCGTPLRIL